MPKAAKETAQMLMPEETPKAPKAPKAPLGFSPQGEVKAARAGSKRAILIDRLAQEGGVALPELAEALSQTGSKVDVAGAKNWVGYDLRQLGLGVRSEGDRLFLVGTPLPHKDASAKYSPGRDDPGPTCRDCGAATGVEEGCGLLEEAGPERGARSGPGEEGREVTVGVAPLFALGQTVATPGALSALARVGMWSLLQRHLIGDWGDLCPEDVATNNRALRDGRRLLSAYHLPDGTKLWIITEADRSVTTLLLPEEY